MASAVASEVVPPEVMIPCMTRVCRRRGAAVRMGPGREATPGRWTGRSADPHQRLLEVTAVGDVPGCPHPDGGQTRLARAHGGRHADGERPCRDLHPIRDDSVGPYGGAGADDRMVEDDRSRADQRLVLERTALEVGQMADHASIAHHGGEPGPGVDDRPVLHRCAGADDDGAVVAAKDGARPDGRLGSDGDVADYPGAGGTNAKGSMRGVRSSSR